MSDQLSRDELLERLRAMSPDGAHVDVETQHDGLLLRYQRSGDHRGVPGHLQVVRLMSHESDRCTCDMVTPGWPHQPQCPLSEQIHRPNADDLKPEDWDDLMAGVNDRGIDRLHQVLLDMAVSSLALAMRHGHPDDGSEQDHAVWLDAEAAIKNVLTNPWRHVVVNRERTP